MITGLLWASHGTGAVGQDRPRSLLLGCIPAAPLPVRHVCLLAVMGGHAPRRIVWFGPLPARTTVLRINIAVVAAATTTVGVALRPLFHRRGTGLRTSPWKPKWALAMWATILTAGAFAALWASRAETFETAVLDVVLTIVVANAATRTINALWYRVNDRAAKHAARTHPDIVMFERSSSEQPFTVVFAVDDRVVSYASTTGWTTAVDGWDVEPCPQHLLDRLTGPF